MTSPYFDGLGEACLATFGDAVPAIYLSQVDDSEPVDVEVIFNARYQKVDQNGIEYGTPRPVAWFRTGLIVPKYGDAITIESVAYKINEIAPDGLEITELGLTAP